MSGPERPVQLGFVDLVDDKRPKRDTSYDIISASSAKLEDLPFPEDFEFRRLSLDLYSFFVEDLPDFSGKNEGMVRVQVNTRNPQDITDAPSDVTSVTKFTAEDGSYAPSFLYKGVFRNILFREWINLKIDLFELDTGADEYFAKITSVLEGVPEIKNLDVLAGGIPYLGVATKLFDGIIKTFGKNPDDHIWGVFPTLELLPVIGGAFLRNGLYVMFEPKTYKTKKDVKVDMLGYRNGEIYFKDDPDIKPSNHLIFGIRIRPHQV